MVAVRFWRGWDLETIVCGLHGHVVPGAAVARLQPGDEILARDLSDGTRAARCTRCGMWIVGALPDTTGDGLVETLPPLSELALPRRGKQLRDAVVMRFVALDRALHCVVFGLLAVALVLLELNLRFLRGEANSLLRTMGNALTDTGQEASRSFLTRQLHRVLSLDAGTLGVLAGTAIAYCVVEGVEAVGLWRERRWAEYLTALATAGFLPFEIIELTHKIGVLRVLTLVVNVAILLWLLWNKRLFGLRGGPKAAAAAVGHHVAVFGAPAPPS